MRDETVFNELNRLRKRLTRFILYSIVIVITITVVSFFYTYAIIGIGVVILVCTFIFNIMKRKYSKRFKNLFMPLVLNKFGEGIKYEYEAGLDESTINGSKLFRRPDRFKSEDYVHGTIDDVIFKTSDIKLSKRTKDSDGNTSYSTYFYGRWFIFDFNKKFKGITMVMDDGAPQDNSLFGSDNLTRVKLEDIDFNKRFNTYTTDEHEAFYLLTPGLMEKMKQLEHDDQPVKVFSRKSPFQPKLYFSFIGSELHIALYNNEDTFEPPILKPINEELIDTYTSDLKLIKEIIHQLKLNVNIFKEN